MNAKVIWLTGLSGSGKSTIAQSLVLELKRKRISPYILDGDILRQGLNKDLGFNESDRTENIRRTAEVAKLMVDSGVTVIAALISPYSKDRQFARSLFAKNTFIEVFINTPINICIQRDPKGWYAKALKGEIKNFTGLDSPYEAPINPEITLNTEEKSVDELVSQIINYLERGNNTHLTKK